MIYLKVLKLVASKKIKDTRKSEPILINSCISCDGSRDLICIFYDN